jgi:hypothetical protein
MDMTEDEQVSTPTQDNPRGTNGDTPVSVSLGNTDQLQSTSETGKTVGSGNRSSMMTKT